MEMRWSLPVDLLAQSLNIMRPNGVLGNEGLALWFGRDEPDHVVVSHVVGVKGRGFRSGPLQLQLSFRAIDALCDLAEAVQAHLVGQIHSHPGLMLDLSPVDMIYGIRRQDYLSLVCPYYAQRETQRIEQCGVHVFDRGTYRRLSDGEIARRICTNHSEAIRLECEVPA